LWYLFQVIRFDGGEEVFLSGEFNSLKKVMPFGSYTITGWDTGLI
jgi:hypothetical protein